MHPKTPHKAQDWATALCLNEADEFEASFNLLGFFETLYRIDERLKAETGKEGACD